MEVIILSLGRGILEQGSREHERMRMYAARLDALHVIVLTRKVHGYAVPIHDGTLHIYPTNSRTRFGMLVDAFFMARSILHKTRPEHCVVSAQDPLETGWLAWLLTRSSRARLHIQVHGDYFADGWVMGSLARRVMRLGATILLRIAPAIRVVSRRIEDSLVKRGISQHAVTVLPIRPELEAFLPHTTKGNAEGFTFLYVGRMAPEKDVPRIVRAFGLLAARYPHMRLRLVGSGREEKQVDTLIATLGLVDKVTRVPWTAEVAEEMAHADALVLASKHEAYGLVLLEAMAVGLPSVTTDVGCVGEVFNDGYHGLVVREGGDEAFSSAMERMAKEPDAWKEYAIHAKKTATEIARTTAEAYADAWVNALRQARL